MPWASRLSPSSQWDMNLECAAFICYHLAVNIEDMQPYRPARDDANENLDSILKASRSLVETCLQGHLTVGPVSFACIGLLGAGLAVAGKLMGDRAAHLDDPALARSARAVSGLGHAADAISAVDSAVGVVQDPIGSAVNSLVNIASDTPDPSQFSETQHRVENAVKKLQDIESQDAKAAE